MNQRLYNRICRNLTSFEEMNKTCHPNFRAHAEIFYEILVEVQNQYDLGDQYWLNQSYNDGFKDGIRSVFKQLRQHYNMLRDEYRKEI